ncbi:MAG: hypothetical protein WCN98_15355 [Verrucomicrobiaceae bacterium]
MPRDRVEWEDMSQELRDTALREAAARDAAAEVIKEQLPGAATVLHALYRMKPDEVGVLLSVMSKRLKEEVDGGWEPQALDPAAYKNILDDFIEQGAEFVDRSSGDRIPWEPRSEEYKQFLKQFAYFLDASILGWMTAVGISHREAAAMLVKQTRTSAENLILKASLQSSDGNDLP